MFDYKKILYALDVNDEGLPAKLSHIVDYAQRKQARLYIVTIHKTIFDYGYAAGVSEHTPNQLIKNKVKEKFDELTHDYQAANDIQIKLIEADSIADGMIDYVHKENVELLILNGHHHGILGRMGSVATKLANNAPCDVVILKHA